MVAPLSPPQSEALLSRYRTPLMGAAMLGVMLFHLGNITSIDYSRGFISWLAAETFWWGVDLFLFLSGMGCFYALRRHGTRRFYLRRAIRILPAVLLAGCLKSLFSEAPFNWGDPVDLRRLLCFDQWYIVTYLTLIASYPVMDGILRRSRLGGILLFASICLLPVAAMAILPAHVYRLGMISWTLTRAPAFVIGAWTASLYAQGGDLLGRYSPGRHAAWVLTATTIYFALHNHFGKAGFATDTPINLMIFVSLLMPSLCYLMTIAFNRIEGTKAGKYFLLTLSVFGFLSLELYLTHEFIYANLLSFRSGWSLPGMIAVAFPLSLACSFALKKGSALLARPFRRLSRTPSQPADKPYIA